MPSALRRRARASAESPSSATVDEAGSGITWKLPVTSRMSRPKGTSRPGCSVTWNSYDPAGSMPRAISSAPDAVAWNTPESTKRSTMIEAPSTTTSVGEKRKAGDVGVVKETAMLTGVDGSGCCGEMTTSSSRNAPVGRDARSATKIPSTASGLRWALMIASPLSAMSRLHTRSADRNDPPQNPASAARRDPAAAAAP